MPKTVRKKVIRQLRQQASEATTSKAAPKLPKEKDILPVLAQLDAASPDERVWACASLSLLLSEGDMAVRRAVGSHKVVDLLIGKANAQGSEADINVRVEALGALRNYAVECGQEVCAEMYNKGLLPVLLAYLPLLSSIMSHLDSAGQPNGMDADLPQDFSKQRQVVWDATDNVLTLIWCLAESAHKSVPTLSSSSSLAPFLLNLLSLHASGTKLSPPLSPSVALTALHTLATLTESNPTFALPFLHLDLDSLLTILSTAPPSKGKRSASKQLLRVLAISVLLNIINCTAMPLPPALLPFSDPKEERRLKKQHAMLADELKQALDFKALEVLVQGLQVDLESVADEDEAQALQIQLEVLGQFALTLDGLATVEEEDEWRGIEEEEEEEAADDFEMLEEGDKAPVDIEMGGLDGEEAPSSFISTSMGGVVLESNLVATLLKLAQPPAASAHGINGDLLGTAENALLAKSSLDQLRDLCRLRALEALNNLLFTFTRAHVAAYASGTASLLAAETLQSTWEALFGLLAAPPAPLSSDLKLAALGSILACAQIGQNALTVGSGETPFLLALARQEAEVDEVKIRALSILALLGSREGVTIQENETIGAALLAPFRDASLEQFQTHLPVLTQALDSLIDVYSDEARDFDQVFRQQGFLPVLKKALPVFKASAKKVDRRKQPEQRFRADAVATNLAAFIKYRESL